MKKILDIKSIIAAIIITASLLYYLKIIFSRGSFSIDSRWLFCAFAIMVMWCLAYMIIHIHRLNKTMEHMARTNEDMKQILETVVKNQLQYEINAEKLHKNTRIMLYEAIAELGGRHGEGAGKRTRKIVGRK